VVAAEPARGLELLLADDVDLAVVDEYDYVPLALPEHLVATALCAEPLVAVLPGVPAGTAAGPIALPDLAGRAWVMPPDDAACGTAVRSACRAAGFEPQVAWETDDLYLLVRGVADGHGVAVLPRLAVVAGSNAGSDAVELRPLARPGLSRRLSAVTRTGASGRAAVQAVLAALTAAAREAQHTTET
jgi:DNA-binding transcriptional LysR family regulator